MYDSCLFLSIIFSTKAPCVNKFPTRCIFWAKNGQCPLNRNFMEKLCWKSCSSCGKRTIYLKIEKLTD